MKKTVSLLLSVLIICLSLSACSGANAEMTEENVTNSIDVAITALKEFDCDTLDKYVDSSTLSVILGYADEHEQFAELGRAIFENLSYEIVNIDLENSTITISVQNKDLYNTASDFAQNLKSGYTTIQLLSLLSDEEFLDAQLGNLCAQIDEASMNPNAYDITLTITQGSKNLVFAFDEYAEDCVSGGALSAIKQIYS